MQITQEKILNYLQTHPPASAGEISRYLKMTAANIRYHLDQMEEEGLVNVIGNRPAGGVGRPILLYSLTSASLGENLIPVLKAFLLEISGSQSTEDKIGPIVHNLIDGKVQGSLNRVQRFNEGIAFLNTMNYHASWEARPQGPRVELRHCPYRDLAQTHPALCELDQIMLRELLGSELVLSQKRTFGKNPFSPCVFEITGQLEEKG
jgi:predicted ArsR family transcriptional regulator